MKLKSQNAATVPDGIDNQDTSANDPDPELSEKIFLVKKRVEVTGRINKFRFRGKNRRFCVIVVVVETPPPPFFSNTPPPKNKAKTKTTTPLLL